MEKVADVHFPLMHCGQKSEQNEWMFVERKTGGQFANCAKITHH